MKIDDWCAQHGITKANYYYRLRRVRGACLASVKSAHPTQIELFLAEHDKLETVTEFHEIIWYALLDYAMVYDKGASDSPLRTKIQV